MDETNSQQGGISTAESKSGAQGQIAPEITAKQTLEGQLRLINPTGFLGFLKLLRQFSQELVMKFDDHSIRVRILDPSEVKMVDAILMANVSPSLFRRSACLRIEELIRCFPKLSGKANQLDFEIQIAPERASFNVGEASFSVRRLEDPKSGDLPVPNVRFSSNFDMRLRTVIQAIDEMKELSDRVELSFSTHAILPCLLVSVSAKSLEKSVIVPIKRARINLSDRCKYDLKGLLGYLSSLRPLSAEVRMNFGRQLPIHISAINPSPPIENIDYYQAPLAEV